MAGRMSRQLKLRNWIGVFNTQFEILKVSVFSVRPSKVIAHEPDMYVC